MRTLYTILGVLLFILLLGFAFKNAEPVELAYYLGYSWKAPLSLMLLITFFSGIIAGVIACLGSLIGQRRKLLALEKEIKNLKMNK
ncbi:LapA family protein [Methylobacillus flagellatus]|uniref:LapA family protein n=1 Tax=Methylobacillus flagellatus TaxID=405 RepID=UPI00285418DC|nr:LapA family protein [Methylobacillus flagellatus]MDR5171012.1 LapA family protein [Methylobacillus flagellatus]